MSNVSRTRTNIATVTSYIKSAITAQNANWAVKEYPYPDMDDILKYHSSVQLQNGAVFIVYMGSPWYATIENTSPARKMNYKIVVCYKSYTDPVAGALYIQNMIDSVVTALDHQIYNSTTGFFVARDSANRIGKNGDGVLSAIIDINVEDN